MANRFLFVCAGLFLLVSSAAEAQLLWSFDQHDNSTQPVTMGITQSSAASLLHGTLPASGFCDQVAVAQHILQTGELVPLPTYPDGTTALESEIFWTVHLWNANFSKDFCAFPARYITGDHVSVGFNGRQYAGGFGVMENTDNCGSGHSGVQSHDVAVVVTVVAVRSTQPVQAGLKSFGNLKVRYR
ncbi:MAG TPA: hypothetical protein VJY35_02840 [Candidatus Eisenbacteria bacterium]|nr:hypothetical protein [Candidatus Eisenbacteria bacterium]